MKSGTWEATQTSKRAATFQGRTSGQAIRHEQRPDPPREGKATGASESFQQLTSSSKTQELLNKGGAGKPAAGGLGSQWMPADGGHGSVA